MISYKIDVKDLAGPALQALGLSMTNFPEEMRKIGDFLVDFYSGEVFDSKGTAIGEPWAPLAASTIKQKGSDEILIDTGAMVTSFNAETDNTSATITNAAPYFPFHQLPKMSSSSKMPQRVMFKVDEIRVHEVVNIMQDGIQKKIDQAVAHGRP